MTKTKTALALVALLALSGCSATGGSPVPEPVADFFEEAAVRALQWGILCGIQHADDLDALAQCMADAGAEWLRSSLGDALADFLADADLGDLEVDLALEVMEKTVACLLQGRGERCVFVALATWAQENAPGLADRIIELLRDLFSREPTATLTAWATRDAEHLLSIVRNCEGSADCLEHRVQAWAVQDPAAAAAAWRILYPLETP